METGVVITQEPVFTKRSIEEAHAGVVLDHSTMDVEKVNLSTIKGEPEVAEVVNGSGNKETDELKHEKEEAMKTISVVEDSKIVKDKTGEDEQGTAFVHEPKNTDDAKKILTDVTLEKEKEDDTNQKPEEASVEKSVIEEGQTETKRSQEQENISKASEEILIKTDEVEEEKDSTTVETSVNRREDERNETVPVEEITRNGEKIVKETAPEQETIAHDVETTERVFLEAEKEAEQRLDTREKDETKTENNEETTVHESTRLKENTDAVEAIKNSDDAGQVSREVTGDREKEEDIIQKSQEVQESFTVIETPTEQGEDIEPKASKDTEEHENVLVRDIPQDETLVPKDESVNTSTVQEPAEPRLDLKEEDEKDAEPSLDPKEVEEAVKTVASSDEVKETIKVVIEPPKPSPDQRSKDTEEDEHVLGRNMTHDDIFVTETESLVTKEDRGQEDKEQEKTDKFEAPIDLALKVDREELMDEKKEADQVAGAQSMERGIALNEPEAEETPVIKHPDVESGEQMEKPSLESPSTLLEETRKTLDKKIQENPDEEVAPDQEDQEVKEKQEESIELKEKAQEERILDLAPLQEGSCLPIEQDDEVKFDEVTQASYASPETLVEARKNEVIKANEEEEQIAADKIQSILEIVDTEPVKSNEETTIHESISLKDDAEKVSHELTVDREKEEDIIHKAQEFQESVTVMETPTTQGEDIEPKASKETEVHEQVLVRDIPQDETLVSTAETVHESAEPSHDLKEKEETVKTVTSSDEVQESIKLMEPPKPSPDQRSKDTEEDENVLGRNMPQGEIFVTEAKSMVSKEDTEKTVNFEEVPSDIALKVDKEELMDEKKESDEASGALTMEKGLELNESKAEHVDQNRNEETEENLVEKLVEKPSLESPSEVAQHQEDQEEGSYGSETKEESSVPESSELKENSQEERSLDLTPLQEESCLPIEQDNEEIKLQKEKIHKHEPENEEVKSDEATQVSSVEAKKIEQIKANEEEQVADSILKTLETVDTEPVKSNEDDIAESLNSAGEEIQIKSKDGENLQIDETNEVNGEKASRTSETSVNGTEEEHNATVLVEGFSKNNESIVNETASEEIKKEEQVSHEVSGDREREEDFITEKTEEVQESPAAEIIQEDNNELKDSKGTMEHEHVLVRDVPQIDTLVAEAEDANTSTVHKFEASTSKTLETTSNETEVDQETQKDIEPSLDLKEDKEKEETETANAVISSDEVRTSDQIDDVQLEESVEVESKETLQVESAEETVPSDLVFKEKLKDDKTEVDKVDETQVMREQRDLVPHEPEEEKTDQTKTDEAEETLVEKDSVKKMQSSSLVGFSEASEETSTSLGDKIKVKLQEEEEEEVILQQEGSSYGLEIKEEALSVPKNGEEVSCLPKETTLNQEHIEKYEPANEVPNDQQSPVEEKSDEVTKVSSVSPSEEQEGGIIVNAVKREHVAEEIQRSLDPMEPEDQERETVSETTEDEEVKKEEPIVQILSEEDAIETHVTEADSENLTAEAEKGDKETEVRDTQQVETIVDTSIVQEAAVLNTLETKINESEEVHSPVGGEEVIKVTKEDTEPRLDLKEDKEQEETETVILSDEVTKDESQEREKCVEVKYKEKDANLLDVPSLESPSETSKRVDEKIEEKPEEVTLHQECQEEKETTLQKEQIEKHESTSEEDRSAYQIPVEEKSDEVIQVSSAPLSVEKNEDLKENEEEQVAERIQRILEPHSSFPSPPEECDSVAEAEKIEEAKVKETEPVGDTREEGLEIYETKDRSPPIEADGSSKLVEEQKMKQDKEILEVEETKAEEPPASETIPQDNATESHEEISKDVRMDETQEEHIRDIETSLTDIDQIQPEEQAHEESPRNEQEKVISTEKEETQTRELEEENMVQHVEKNDHETLIAETKKEEFENLEAPQLEESKEDKSQEVSETIEEIESKGDDPTPAFITELEDQIPKQIEKIHEEETKEPHKVEAQSVPVEASYVHQTPSSELGDKTPKKVEEIHEEEEEIRVPRESFSASMLASGEDDQVTVEEGNPNNQEKEESVGETKPKESEVERRQKSDETSSKVTKVEDEDTQVTEIMKAQSLSNAPEDACLEKEECKDLGKLQLDAIMEDLMNENSDDFTFSKSIGEAENSSNLPVVGILKELQMTILEENERETESGGKYLHSINAEPETLEKNETPSSEIIEANRLQQDERGETETTQEQNSLVEELKFQEEHKEEEVKVQDSITREFEAHVEEILQEETPADLSLEEVLSGENILIPSSALPFEDSKQEDFNASTLEKISLQEEEEEEDFEISNKEQNAEAQETVKEEDQIVDTKEEKKSEEKLSGLTATKDNEQNFMPEVKKDQEDWSELGDTATLQVEKEGEAHSVLGNDQEINEAVTSEKQITVPNEEHKDDTKSNNDRDFPTKEAIRHGDSTEEKHDEVTKKIYQEESKQTDTVTAIKEEIKQEDKQTTHESFKTMENTDDATEKTKTENNNQEDASELGVGHASATPQVVKEEENHNVLGNDQEVNEVVASEKEPLSVAEKELNEEHVNSQAISDDTKSNSEMDFPLIEVKKVQEDKKEETVDALTLREKVQEKQSSDIKYVQEDLDDEIKDDGHDSVVSQKMDSDLIEEKEEVNYVKTEPEDAIKHGVSTEEKNNISEKVGQEATKEIYQEECKQTDSITAIKDEIKEEKKETPEGYLNNMKNTDDATDEIDKLSSVSETQDEPPKQEDEVPTQQKREIADDVQKLENLKIAEEMQQKDGEDETEQLVKEPARKSLSDIIQKVKTTDKTEVETTEHRIEEEAKAEGEDEDGDEHKDDKTSPDSIVMVEAKDTVIIIKTQKKSHGILSGVGSKVKYSISKVKKALTGKSSHTTKPSSPQ